MDSCIKHRIVITLALLGCPADEESTSGNADDSTSESPTTDPGTSTGTPPSTSSSDETTDEPMTTTTDSACTSNDDCGDVEVCLDGECIIATETEYRVEITSWQPEDCGTVATPDLYVVVSRNGNPGDPSGTAGSCPAAWGSFCLTPAVEAEVIEFQLWDEDVGGDDHVDRLCWPTPTDPNASCGALAPSMLHDGGYTGGTAMNGQIAITFTPGC